MSDPKRPLTPDDARALLSDHLEGGLDEGARAEVDALLASDAQLARDHGRLKATLELLGNLPDPEPPADIVGKVRDRLAAERRRASEPPELAEVAGARRFRWGGIEAAIGLAAAASVAVFIAVAGGHRGGAGDGTQAAGTVVEDGHVAAAAIIAPGIPATVVMAVAAKAGMETHTGNVYEGDKRAAARFLMGLREAAAARGVEISGFVPDADRVRIEVRAQ